MSRINSITQSAAQRLSQIIVVVLNYRDLVLSNIVLQFDTGEAELFQKTQDLDYPQILLLHVRTVKFNFNLVVPLVQEVLLQGAVMRTHSFIPIKLLVLVPICE